MNRKLTQGETVKEQPNPAATPKPPVKKAPTDKKTGSARNNPKILMYMVAALAALAVGAVIFAVVSVSDAQGKLSQVEAQTSPAIVAKVPIERGAVVTPDMVATIDVPNTYLIAEATTDLSAIVGKTALANISANAQITQSNLAGAGNTTMLAQAVTPGKVAAGITVNSETGVAGLVRQGDYVDVLAEGSVLVEHVRVLALDDKMAEGITQYSTVTLELTTEEAGAVQMAQLDNPVRLVLNSDAASADTSAQGVQVEVQQ